MCLIREIEECKGGNLQYRVGFESQTSQTMRGQSLNPPGMDLSLLDLDRKRIAAEADIITVANVSFLIWQMMRLKELFLTCLITN